jgi:hypothetical protein
MAAKYDNDRRMNRIRNLLQCKTDVELAQLLETNQPQISRWRNTGFPHSTAKLLDSLLAIVSKLKREVVGLKKEIKSQKQGPGENSG